MAENNNNETYTAAEDRLADTASAAEEMINSGEAAAEEQICETCAAEKKSGDARKKHRKKRRVLRIALIIVMLLLAAAAAAGIFAYKYASEVRESASVLKSDVKKVAACLSKQDPDGADKAISDMEKDAQTLKTYLESKPAQLAGKLPRYKEQIDSASDLIDLLLDASDKLLKPLSAQIRAYPLDSLKTEDGGIKVAVLSSYISFAEEKMPYVEQLADGLESADLGAFDSGGKIKSYVGKLKTAMEYYERAEKYLPLIKAFIGSGEDRLYLFAAQNSSEIRSSGGFPGSVGTIRIKDGVLKLEEFKPINRVIVAYSTAESAITQQEINMFGTWILAPRDADFCPDYERVAELWAIGYKNMNGESVDGVISATPVIIQRILALTGEIVLSDGSVLNGENAIKELEYNMYYRYFGAGSNSKEGNAASDALFAEAAQKTMDALIGGLDISKIKDYFDLVEDCAADRTLMLWFADETEQETSRAVGLNCSLNRDSTKPEAGIYFALTNPGRMGWFLDMNVEIEETETHEDGSKTYAITLTMSNTMTQEEYNAASRYISGTGYRGVVTGYLYLFAPAGGSVGEVTSYGTTLYFYETEYRGLQVRFNQRIFINRGDTISFTYTVTTAPGEQAPLGLSMTPTLQDYR